MNPSFMSPYRARSQCFASQKKYTPRLCLIMHCFQFLILVLCLVNAQPGFALGESNSSQAGESGLLMNPGAFDFHTTPDFFNINYFGIFYGPSVGNPTSYQPDLNGKADLDHPVVLKNFLTVSHALTDEIAVSATGYWMWQPIVKQGLELGDPFIKISHNSLLHFGSFNMYGDLRVHFPISSETQHSGQQFGIQTFQSLTYELPQSHVTLGTYVSQRANFYGSRGMGSDLELYLGPNINYQVSEAVGLSLLYEMYSVHFVGQRTSLFTYGSTDLEPGVVWGISPRVMLNPYLNLMTGGKVNLNTTSLGVMVSWTLM